MSIATARSGFVGLILVGLAACASSPPPQYYTLATVGGAAASGPPSVAAIEFLPVTVPQQVDQPNVMIRTAPQELTPDYNARWAASLGEEVKSGLATTLQQVGGITDVTGLGSTGIQPLWRMQVQIRRFDLPRQGPVGLEAVWRARRIAPAGTEAWLCRSEVTQVTSGATVPDLVAAQRQAVAQVGRRMAALIRGEAVPTDCQAERAAAA